MAAVLGHCCSQMRDKRNKQEDKVISRPHRVAGPGNGIPLRWRRPGVSRPPTGAADGDRAARPTAREAGGAGNLSPLLRPFPRPPPTPVDLLQVSVWAAMAMRQAEASCAQRAFCRSPKVSGFSATPPAPARSDSPADVPGE